MADKFILNELRDGVSIITLNRPDVLNSFNRAMAGELQAAIADGARRGEVRALLLRAEGRAFCAGQDLAEVAPDSKGNLPDLGEIVRRHYNPIIRAIRSIEKPVVCAVNGVAAGAGANIALACDIVLAAKEANFVQAFSKIGLIPDSGGTFLLPRLVGLARATALTFLAEKLSAEQAVEMGLIYKAVDAAALYEEALTLAKHLATQPTVGLGLTKRLFNQSFSCSLEEQLNQEEQCQRSAGASADYREGVMAFLEKRKASFTGR